MGADDLSPGFHVADLGWSSSLATSSRYGSEVLYVGVGADDFVSGETPPTRVEIFLSSMRRSSKVVGLVSLGSMAIFCVGSWCTSVIFCGKMRGARDGAGASVAGLETPRRWSRMG